MSEYKNLIVDVSGLEEGKFYKVYTDSNGTTLLIPKDTDDALATRVNNNEKRLMTLENKDENESMHISNSPNAVINIIKDDTENKYKRIDIENITEIVIPYTKIITNIKVFNRVQSPTSTTVLFEQVEEGVQIRYSEDTLTKQKQIFINSNNPITGYIEIFYF